MGEFITENMGLIACIISAFALLIAIFAMVNNSSQNSKTRKIYADTFKPVLTMKLVKHNKALCVNIQNTGKMPAKDITLKVRAVVDNGCNDVPNTDKMFDMPFTLYPNESIQGMVAPSGDYLDEYYYPLVKFLITYKVQDVKKPITMNREIRFSRTGENKKLVNVIVENMPENDINGTVTGAVTNITEALESIRTTNEGAFKEIVDKINSVATEVSKVELNVPEVKIPEVNIPEVKFDDVEMKLDELNENISKNMLDATERIENTMKLGNRKLYDIADAQEEIINGIEEQINFAKEDSDKRTKEHEELMAKQPEKETVIVEAPAKDAADRKEARKEAGTSKSFAENLLNKFIK